MNPDDFEKIRTHLSKAGITNNHMHIAYTKFIESVGAGIDISREGGRKDPTTNELRKICEQSLTEPILNLYVDISKIAEETEKKSKAKKSWHNSFLGGVTVGIAANFLFMVLLLLSYSFGKDYWVNILSAL